jgi:Acetyltransferase (isoleucine patch superfamily)
MSFFTNLAYKAVKLIRSPKLLLIKSRLGRCGKEVVISMPCKLSVPQNVYMDSYTLIQPNCTFIIDRGKVFIGKWSSIASNCTIITDSHKPTVGINTRMMNRYSINDDVRDICIGEDCWIGAGVILMSGASVGRGCVAAAGALVNKAVPPYAVVAGVPAKIIASVFSKEQIIEHEKYLYPENERMSSKDLDELFEKYFEGKKSIGIEGMSDADRKKALEHQYMQEAIPQ